MKFLQIAALDRVNNALRSLDEDADTSLDVSVTMTLDAYSTTLSKKDRSTITTALCLNLPNVYSGHLDGAQLHEAIVAPSPNMVAPDYDVYTEILCGLHHHYGPDYDFSTVPMYSFVPITWSEAECEVAHRISSDPHRRMVWQAVMESLRVTPLTKTTSVDIYSYSGQDPHNPLRDSTLWSHHYFFYQRSRMMILMVMSGAGRLHNGFGSDDEVTGAPATWPSPAIGEELQDEDFERWETERSSVGGGAQGSQGSTASKGKKKRERMMSPVPLMPSPISEISPS